MTQAQCSLAAPTLKEADNKPSGGSQLLPPGNACLGFSSVLIQDPGPVLSQVTTYRQEGDATGDTYA
jgi:hypothetical protein